MTTKNTHTINFPDGTTMTFETTRTITHVVAIQAGPDTWGMDDGEWGFTFMTANKTAAFRRAEKERAAYANTGHTAAEVIAI